MCIGSSCDSLSLPDVYTFICIFLLYIQLSLQCIHVTYE